MITLLEILEPRIAPATFLVSQLSDSGEGSLRQAILDANSSPGPDEIIFQSPAGKPLKGTIILSSDLPTVTDDLSIFGPVAGSPKGLTINGSKKFSILKVSDASITIQDITLKNGSSLSGGALFFDSSGEAATLKNVHLTANRAVSSNPTDTARGGAIFIENGSLTLEKSLLTKNLAIGASSTSGANLGNAQGGAIYSKSDVTILSSIISGNIARGGSGLRGEEKTGGSAAGGAIAINDALATLSIENSTLSKNQAIGGNGSRPVRVSYYGSFILEGGAPSGNARGGAIYAPDADSISIASSKIIQNSARGAAGTIGKVMGGGIFVLKTPLQITDSNLSKNLASWSQAKLDSGKNTHASGGAIYSASDLTIQSTILSGNIARAGKGAPGVEQTGGTASGGAIAIDDSLAKLTVENSILAKNRAFGGKGSSAITTSYYGSTYLYGGGTGGDAKGGAISAESFDSISITSTQLIKNSARGAKGPAGGGSGLGGAIHLGNTTSSELQITESIITGNRTFSGKKDRGAYSYPGESSGGAIYSRSDLSIEKTTLSRNSARTGGALWFDDSTSIVASTFSNNKSKTGGAIFQDLGDLTLTNSTLSANKATSEAGAIFISTGATAKISNSTITKNSARLTGGIANTASPVEITSSIIALNSAKSNPDLAGQFSSTNCLIGFQSPNTVLTLDQNNLIGVKPLLGTLAPNGGTTPTHLPLPGSPAINAGLNPLMLGFDQRGPGFPRTQGSATDIGAVEAA